MMSTASCPPLSAGIERLLSSMALVHTKLRIRLGRDKVAKLVHVYRHFGWEEDDHFEETSEGGKKLKKIINWGEKPFNTL